MEQALNTDVYRERLLALEEKLTARVGDEVDTVEQPGRADPSNAGADSGDRAQVDELDDEYLALAQTDAAVLALVRAALNRLDEGTYGRCLVDGEPIPENRLESIPWTPYCLKHQAALEARARTRTPSL
jgi:RNA polymerase-binding transcription factor DksA